MATAPTPAPTPSPTPAPTDPAGLAALIEQDVLAIISFYKNQVQGQTLTAPAIITLLTNGVATIMRLVETAGAFSDVDKRQAIIDAVMLLYTQVIEPLNIPGVPVLLETLVIDPLLRREIPVIVGGLIDSLTTIFNRTGWFDLPGQSPSAAPSTAMIGVDLTPPGFVPY